MLLWRHVPEVPRRTRGDRWQCRRPHSCKPRPDPPLPRSLLSKALRSPGRPLDLATREFMEAEFGHDFQDVRIHTGPAADKSNQELGAQAFTTGTDIVFAAGRYAPEQPASQHLLAHELTHVLQQCATAALGHVGRFSEGPTRPIQRAGKSGTRSMPPLSREVAVHRCCVFSTKDVA